jgi:arabinose-5-phosphate isomerase
MALANSKNDPATHQATMSALRTLATERDGLGELIVAIGDGLGDLFAAAVERIAGAKGRVIVSGMGKSGHVARKIAATLASTGTPALYVHPAEASHGDLGMIQRVDVILALSWSGETAELADLIGYAKRFRVPLVAITSSASSTLGRQADLCLALPKAREACPNGLAPTTSTTMQLALGDALAVALLEQRGFTADHFRVFHPGGKLGAMLKHVGDIMHTGDRLPIVPVGTVMADALVVQSEKSFGCVIVVDERGDLAGIVTDGDVRRHMSGDLLQRMVEDVMTPSPTTVAPDMLLGEALEIVESRKRGALIVADGMRPIGLVHVLDLLRAGVA